MARDGWEKLFVFSYKEQPPPLEDTRSSKPGLCPQVHGLLDSTPHHCGRTIALCPLHR